MSDWQPIETAPKDGTKFDVWIPDAFGGHRMCDLSFNFRGKLRKNGMLTEADMPRWPTHWMPISKPPVQFCQVCNSEMTFPHDHKPDLSGIDDGPPIGCVYRKKAAPKPSSELARIRAQAWQTRRARYGAHGHR